MCSDDQPKAIVVSRWLFSHFFFFNDTATTEIYTLSLHDALPISSFCYFVGCWVRAVDGGTYPLDRKSTRLNSSHLRISYAVFCLKKNKTRVDLTALVNASSWLLPRYAP